MDHLDEFGEPKGVGRYGYPIFQESAVIGDSLP